MRRQPWFASLPRLPVAAPRTILTADAGHSTAGESRNDLALAHTAGGPVAEGSIPPIGDDAGRAAHAPGRPGNDQTRQVESIHRRS
jgi:hypothetical protein